MKFVYDDGGRSAAGHVGIAGDCVCRSIAIAAGLPYQQVYEELSVGCKAERRIKTKGGGAVWSSSCRNGVRTSRKWFKDYMQRHGWKFVPTMGIGTGCKVHLVDGELPMGRLVVSLSKHYTAVIDGVIHDLWSPEREVHAWTPERGHHIQRRCVYGYWIKAS